MWKDLKPKFQQFVRVQSYEDTLEEMLCQMFTFENFPDTVSTRFISRYLLREGICAIWEVPDYGYEVTHCQLAGKPYPDGRGSKAICSTNNGVVREFDDWKHNDNLVIIFNNALMTPDLNIGRFADMLAEVDLSMVYNVFYSRYMPIPVVDDEDTKKAVNFALDNLKNGEIRTILHKNILNELLGDNSKIDMLNLTDVTHVDRIQYLSRLHEDLMRRFFNANGMNMGGSGKVAQATQEETSSGNGLSMILPYSRYYELQIGAKLLNSKFGWNVIIDFSDAWKYQFAKYMTVITAKSDNVEINPNTMEIEKTEPEEESSPANKDGENEDGANEDN